MTTEDALKKLEPFTSDIPIEALNTIRETWPAAEPVLLEELDWRIEHPYAADRSGRFVYALFLLAEMKSTAAFERYITLASFPDQMLDQIFGDMLTERLKYFFAHTGSNQIAALQAFVENRHGYEFARAGGVAALELLVKAGDYPLKKMEMYCIELLSRRLEQRPSYIWDAVISSCVHLRIKTALSFIKTAYDRGLADPFVERYEHIEKTLRSDVVDAFAHEFDAQLKPTEQEMRPYADWWGKQNKIKPEDHSGLLNAPANERRQQKTKPLAGKEPGRNEPCPCGSGKKYKKCCIETGYVRGELLDGDELKAPLNRTDEWIMAGYYYLKHRDEHKAFSCWAAAWPAACEEIPESVTDPDDDRCNDLFNGYDFFSNWIQDLQMVIEEHAGESHKMLQFGFDYFPQLLERFPNMRDQLRRNVEASLARMENQCGLTQKAESRLRRMIEQWPNNAQGYVLLAELYSLDAMGEPDIPQAQQLLTQARLNATNCDDWDVDARLTDLR